MVHPSEYTECQAFFPVVRIGSPPRPLGSVAPPPFGSQGGATLTCGGGGWEDPIPTKGQTLWYSKNTIIPLRYIPCPQKAYGH
jgi:hypothetical protein